MTSQTSTCHLWIQHCLATFSVEDTDQTLAQLSQINWIIQLCKTIGEPSFPDTVSSFRTKAFLFTPWKLDWVVFRRSCCNGKQHSDWQSRTFWCKCSLVVKWCFPTTHIYCLVEFAACHSERGHSLAFSRSSIWFPLTDFSKAPFRILLRTKQLIELLPHWDAYKPQSNSALRPSLM